ncbi:hypothetical protein GCM10023093_31460 [Nemorincola caseinilytica]|uniref:histidine kinase n=1 Tax=Nemorincola caseinilytica TaxID=2054315 RepID=A0ABP8NNS0_9BACT
MNNPLPFFNWSLKKAEHAEPDSFIRVRIPILYTILMFSVAKAAIVVGMGIGFGQTMQVSRAVVALCLYVGLVKWLLYRPAHLKVITHVMILLGVAIVWTNIFVFAHKINLVTIQFVFMVLMSSFFALGSTWGVIYTITSTLPVVILMLFRGSTDIYSANTAQELASPGFEIIVILNFVSIAVSHYLFFRAFHLNLGEKEELNKDLTASIAVANQLATSRTNFLSTMSHELRTPLNSVVGITELLIEDKPEERQKENLRILQLSAHDLLSLINNILDVNKLNSDKLVLDSAPFVLSELIKDIADVMRIRASSRKLDLVMDVDQRITGMTVVSDPTRLAQVMYNLVGNAIKFTDRGSVTIKLELAGRTASGMDVMFSVIDTGVGIPADKHEAIFDLFSQAGSHILRQYGGTGLGLAIVKQTLLLFNSKINLESIPGKGSRFFFTLPLTIAAAGLEPELPHLSQGTGDMGHVKVLIAEDNNINRMIIKKQLQKLGIEPVIVENGKQAYEAFIASDFDAIFVDLHMPVMGGYEAVSKIRSDKDPVKARTYTVAFTASVTEQQRIVDAGFDDHLYKPVSLNDLRNKLEKVAAMRLVN